MRELTKEGQLAQSRPTQAASLADLPADKLWRKSAPTPVRRQWRTDRSAAMAEWSEVLAAALPDDFYKAGALSFGWANEEPEARAAIRLTKPRFAGPGGVGSLAEQTLEDAIGAEDSPAGALRIAALAHAMPRLVAVLPHEPWWSITDRLAVVIEESLAAAPDADADADVLLAHQLIAGEAGLALATGLADVRPLRALRKPSAAALSEGILAMTDGEGMPHAQCLPSAAALLACWTRCQVIAKRSGKRVLDAAATTQYEWLVRQMLRLSRPDGSLALTGGSVPLPLWVAALAAGGDEADMAAAGKRLRLAVPKRAAGGECPEPSVDSEWSGLAVLASGWRPKSPRITVAYSGDQMQLEVAAGGVLISGDWPLQATMHGTSLVAAGEWEEQCWFSDHESDYLELALPLVGGAKLERLIFLAHDLQLAFVSEVLLGRLDEAADLRVTTRLPLSAGVSLRPHKETREAWLMSGDTRLAGITPLALAEWRVDPRGGELTQQDSTLKLAQAEKGLNLMCPLVLDFKPTRFAKQRTWRRLTVAEQLERVGPDVAAAFRYQSGKDQLVAYRSLQRPGNRTFLGQNYSSEAVIGRFQTTGQSQGLLEEYFEVESTPK